MIYHLCSTDHFLLPEAAFGRPTNYPSVVFLTRDFGSGFLLDQEDLTLSLYLVNIYLASSLGSKIQGSFLDLWQFAGIHDKRWITHFHFPSILYIFFPEPTQTIVEEEVISPSTSWKSSSIKLTNTLSSLLCIFFFNS